MPTIVSLSSSTEREAILVFGDAELEAIYTDLRLNFEVYSLLIYDLFNYLNLTIR